MLCNKITRLSAKSSCLMEVQVVEVVEATSVVNSGDGSVERGGYHQELKRTLGSFQVFAISFAFISVAVGIFGTYDDVLQNAGPVGIWLWIAAAIGQTLVALVIAQFAARISLSGSSYQWASRLANPKIGWGFGWLTFCYLVIGRGGVDFALVSQALMPLVGLEPDEGTARMITLVVLLVQCVLAVASTRIVSLINTAAVGIELALVVVVAVALIIAVAITGNGSVDNLTSQGVAADAPGYFAVGGGLMLAMIMGLATLVGFDAAANLAEEAKDPFRTRPTGDRRLGGGGRTARAAVSDHADHRDRRHPRGQRQRVTGGDDHARSARSGDGTNTAGRRHFRVLRRRFGDPDVVLPDRLRDVPRLHGFPRIG